MRLMLATQNQGKVREIKDILSDPTLEVVLPPQELEVEENGNTFQENAWLKAKEFYENFHVTTLADDSGLVVSALDGRPGVFSKRYGKDDEDRNQKILSELEGQTDRSACFICVICVYGDGVDVCFEGKVYGTIADRPRGKDGFGYDPIFIPEGYDKTFAELGVDVKNSLSHRARALMKVKGFFESRG